MLQRLVTQCTSAGWCIPSEICCFIFSGVVDERLGRDVMSGLCRVQTQNQAIAGIRGVHFFLCFLTSPFPRARWSESSARDWRALQPMLRLLPCVYVLSAARVRRDSRCFPSGDSFGEINGESGSFLVGQEAPSREPHCAVGGKYREKWLLFLIAAYGVLWF